ncbi:DUF5337 family protein [Roseicyclus sp. F158]|uniref:DUF5337 family protein n=1 Tax=Tropicimonas omnivorans TaxID=3075590 RepID=A0ABU3DIX5_9RHOB|nr:DUF5337 family protein [Roseicyclus sp. F158]MDT0683679.1 DUF5337 family protein [Roseicyclus sp. F158]
MTEPRRKEDRSAPDGAALAKRRSAGVVIALSGLAALLAPWIVATTGLAPRYEMLFYFAALAGFVWSLAVLFQILRDRG